MTQIERLKILGQWMRNELAVADLYDLETVRAIKAVIAPIADALNIDTRPRDPGSDGVIMLTVCHDTDRGGYWGICEACGVLSVVEDERDKVLDCFGLHMARTHPSFTLALNDEEVTL
jgi:hypothetical protein